MCVCVCFQRVHLPPPAVTIPVRNSEAKVFSCERESRIAKIDFQHQHI